MYEVLNTFKWKPKFIIKFISPQMDKFETDESKLLSHKIDEYEIP